MGKVFHEEDCRPGVAGSLCPASSQHDLSPPQIRLLPSAVNDSPLAALTLSCSHPPLLSVEEHLAPSAQTFAKFINLCRCQRRVRADSPLHHPLFKNRRFRQAIGCRSRACSEAVESGGKNLQTSIDDEVIFESAQKYHVWLPMETEPGIHRPFGPPVPSQQHGTGYPHLHRY